MINFLNLLGAFAAAAVSASFNLQPKKVSGNYDSTTATYTWWTKLSADNNNDFQHWYSALRDTPSMSNYYLIFNYVRNDKSFVTLYYKSDELTSSIESSLVSLASYDSDFYLGYCDYYHINPLSEKMEFRRALLGGIGIPSIKVNQASLDSQSDEDYNVRATQFQYYNGALHLYDTYSVNNVAFWDQIGNKIYSLSPYQEELIQEGYTYYGILGDFIYSASIPLTYFGDRMGVNKPVVLSEIDSGTPDEMYNNGYNNGYSAGVANQKSEDEDLISQSYQQGYNDGFTDADNMDSTALTIFTGIINVALIPVNFFLGIFNFEVFGINIGGLVTSFMMISIILIFWRVIVGGKNDK